MKRILKALFIISCLVSLSSSSPFSFSSSGEGNQKVDDGILQYLGNFVRKTIQVPDQNRVDKLANETIPPTENSLNEAAYDETNVYRDGLSPMHPNDYFSGKIIPPAGSSERIYLDLLVAFESGTANADKLDALVAKLKEAVEHEGWLQHVNPTVRERIMESLKEIQLDPRAAVTQRTPFTNLLLEIRPLDRVFLLKLLEESAKMQNMFKNETVIYFIGVTGSGKTLLIHYLHGSTLKEVLIDGVLKIVDDPKNLELKEFRIGVNEGSSETVSLRAIKLKIPGTDDYIYICDTPGFFDSSFVELDLINGISVVKALQQSAAVYPVLVMNEHLKNGKWGGLKTLLNLLGEMIPFAARNRLLRSFSYVFGEGYPDLQYLANALPGVRQNLNDDEKANENVKGFLDDMIKKTKARRQAYLFRPLDKDEEKKAEMLRGMTFSDPITNCKEEFATFLSDRSHKRIAMQKATDVYVVNHLLRQHGLSMTESDLSLIAYRLNMIQEIIKHTDLPSYLFPYNELVTGLQSTLGNLIESQLNSFRDAMEGIAELQNGDTSLNLQFQQLVKTLHFLESLMKIVGNDHFPSFPFSPSKFSKQIENLVLSRISHLIPTSMKDTLPPLSKQRIIAFTNRLDILNSYFPVETWKAFEEIYLQLCNRTMEIDRSLPINVFNPAIFTHSLDELAWIDKSFSSLFVEKLPHFADHYKSVKSKLLFKVSNYSAELAAKLSQTGSLSENEKTDLVNLIKIFSEIGKQTSLYDHFNTSDELNPLSSFYQSHFVIIINFLQRLVVKTLSGKSNCESSFSEAQSIVQEILFFQNLEELKEIKPQLIELRYEFESSLMSISKKFEHRASKDLALLLGYSATMESTQNLASSVICSLNMRSISSQNLNHSSDFDSFSEKILQLFRAMENESKKIKLSIESSTQDIQTIAKFNQQISVSGPLIDAINGTREFVSKSNTSIFIARQKPLDYIRKRITSVGKEISAFEKDSVVYLYKYKNVSDPVVIPTIEAEELEIHIPSRITDSVIDDLPTFKFEDREIQPKIQSSLNEKPMAYESRHIMKLDERMLLSAVEHLQIRNYLEVNIEYGLYDLSENSFLDQWKALLTTYCHLIDDQLEKVFQEIISYKSEKDINFYYNELARVFFMRLSEVLELSKLTEFYQLYQKWLSFENGKIPFQFQQWEGLARKLALNENLSELDTMWQILQLLKKVDDYPKLTSFPSGPQSTSMIVGVSGRDVIGIVAPAIASITEDFVQRCRIWTDSHQYELVDRVAHQLNNTNQIGKLDTCLMHASKHMQDLEKSISLIQINNEMKPIEIHRLAEDSGHLYDSNFHLSSFLKERGMKIYHDDFFLNIWTTFSRSLSQFSRIDGFLTAKLYRNTISVQTVLMPLQKIFSNYNFSSLPESYLNPLQIVSNTLSVNDKLIINHLDSLKINYLQNRLESLTISLDYLRFSEVNNDPTFHAAWQEMLKNLKSNLYQRMNSFLQCERKFNTCYSDKVVTFEGLERVITLWPADIQNELEVFQLLTRAKQSLESCENERNTIIDDNLMEKKYCLVVKSLKEMLEIPDDVCDRTTFQSRVSKIQTSVILPNLLSFSEAIKTIFSQELWSTRFMRTGMGSSESPLQKLVDSLTVLTQFFVADYQSVSKAFLEQSTELYPKLGNLINEKFGVIQNNLPQQSKELIRFSGFLFHLMNSLTLTMPYSCDFTNPKSNEILSPYISESIDQIKISLPIAFHSYQKEYQDMLEKKQAVSIWRIWQDLYEMQDSIDSIQNFFVNEKIPIQLFTLSDAFYAFDDKYRNNWLATFEKSVNQIFQEGNNEDKKSSFYKETLALLQFSYGLKSSAINSPFASPTDIREAIESFPQKIMPVLLTKLTEAKNILQFILKMEQDEEINIKSFSAAIVNKFRDLYGHFEVLNKLNKEFILPIELQPYLKYYEEVNKFVEQQFQLNLKDVETTLLSTWNEETMEKAINGLLQMNNYLNLHGQFETKLGMKLHELLKRFSATQINSIYVILCESEDDSSLLTREKEIFDEGWIITRNKQTTTVTFESALSLLRVEPALSENAIQTLRNAYSSFESEYEDNLKKSRNKPLALAKQGLIKEITEIRKRHKELDAGSIVTIQWNSDHQKDAISLMVKLFALKSLESPSWKPHPVQVLSLFLLFDISNDKYPGAWTNVNFGATLPLENHLLNIGTGEGKSITLAIASSILALMGYEVHIACYRKFLSDRDEQAFRDFFRLVGIEDTRIVYGTFQELTEGFINAHGDLRGLIRHELLFADNTFHNAMKNNMNNLHNMQSSTSSKKSNPPKVLMIDEVDTFLNPKFYQETYSVNVDVSTSEVVDLMHFIWNLAVNTPGSSPVDQSKIFDSSEYKNFLNRFDSKWTFLMKQSVLEMIEAVNLVKDHREENEFYFNEETHQIGYPEEDDYSYSKVFGYETVFVYFREYQQRGLSIDNLRSLCSVNIDGGSFLYNQFPNLYNGIFGVSGSLSVLLPEQRDVLRKLLKIQKESFIPSAYGIRDQRFHFEKNNPRDIILISEETLFHTSLIQEIENRIDHGNRAVLVFFASEKELESFYHFCLGKLTSQKYLVQKMLSQDSYDERAHRIRLAVTAGTVTLAIRDYGRGTDFVSFPSSRLNKNGGLHVIQTFFSKDISEEWQIKGRTARDSNHGSYSMVLLARHLLELYPTRLTMELLTKFKDSGMLYDGLNDIRMEQIREDLQQMVSNVADMQYHELSMKLRNDVFSLNDYHQLQQSIHEFIRKSYLRYSPVQPKRVLVALDYSGSMEGEKITAALSSIEWFVKNYVNDIDYFGLALFSSSIELNQIPLMLKENNEQFILSKIKELNNPKGGTRLYDVTKDAIELLSASSSSSSYETWLFIVTDGADSTKTKLDTVLSAITNAPDIGIAILGVGNDVNADVLKKMAEANPTKGIYELASGDKIGVATGFGKTALEIKKKGGSYNGK